MPPTTIHQLPSCRTSAIHETHHTYESVFKNVRRRQQTDNDERFVWEVEEISGVDEDPFALEQMDHESFSRNSGRHADDRGPAALDSEDITRGKRVRELTKPPEIRGDTLVDRFPDRRRSPQQPGGRGPTGRP